MKLCDEAEALGYAFQSTNSKGHLVYAHPAGHTVKINPSCRDDQARTVSLAMRKTLGVHQLRPCRNAKAAKVRQAKERERLAADRRKIQAAHDDYLARIANGALIGADPDVIRRIEQYEQELAELDRLMRSVPSGGDHQGRRKARHTSGERPAS